MINFELYIHGVPSGQDFICKEKVENYLSKFYPKSTDEGAHLSFVIDYKDGVSYYTFYLKGGKGYSVTDCQNNRSGSYFAMTVAFIGQFCTKVHTLFDLLDALFQQVVCGKLFEVKNKTYHYKIEHFKDVQINGIGLVETLSNVLQDNLNVLSFEKLDVRTTSNESIFMSLSEADSTFFFKQINKSRVILSTEYPTYLERLEQLKRDIDPIRQENLSLQNERQQLSATKKQLEEQCQSYKKEIDVQRKKIDEHENECQKSLSQIQGELGKVKAENKKLKASMEEFHGCVSTIEISTKEMMRQLAGRFPAKPKETIEEPMSEHHSHRKESSRSIWLLWVNTLLLLLLVSISVYVLFNRSKVDYDLLTNDLSTSVVENEPIVPVEVETNIVAANINTPNYSNAQIKDNIESINIKGYSGTGSLKKGHKYTLELVWKDEKPLLVNNGTWKCDDECVNIINDTLIINSALLSNYSKDVVVEYVVNDSVVKERKIKISK